MRQLVGGAWKLYGVGIEAVEGIMLGKGKTIGNEGLEVWGMCMDAVEELMLGKKRVTQLAQKAWKF